MTLTIAIRNLLHDKVRLAVTLTGVAFAVLLIAVQAGLFVGFTRATSAVIDNGGADIWVASRGVRNFDITIPLSQKVLHQVLSVPGVAEARRMVVHFANWKKSTGGGESVEVVGFELTGTLGWPWNVVEGDPSLLAITDTVVVDELYKEKLGMPELGSEAEINGHRVRVVAYTRGIRSFTTSPYVFCSLPVAQTAVGLREGKFDYVLVKVEPGHSIEEVRRTLADRIDAVDVFIADDFARLTQFYWMFTTGGGIALLIAAVLGLVVGVVIVAQTLYATTMDHLAEFGTLRAIGARNAYLHRIIVIQALVSAVAGYIPGVLLSFLVVSLSEKGGAAIVLPAPLVAGLFVITVGMCVGASLISVHKVTRLDPVMVFRGR